MLTTYKENSTTYNSYVSYNDVSNLEEHIPVDMTDFKKLCRNKQESLLMMATKRIDNLYRFKGYKTKCKQCLSFPRCDNGLCDNDSNGIHDDIKCATLIMALSLNDSLSGVDRFGGARGNLRREEIGRTLKYEYFQSVPNKPKDIIDYDTLIKLCLDRWLQSSQITLCRA
jgi:hypothetical protein